MKTDNTPIDKNEVVEGNQSATAICSAFELRGTNIHDGKTKKLICTIWPERKASEERLKGESWLAMYQRTEPEREEIQRHTEGRAADVCGFLNSQNAESSHARNER